MKKSLVAFYLPLLAALGGGLQVIPEAMAAVYPYSADTTTPARRQGAVAAGGINWNCTGSRCSAFSSLAVPTVATCHALAMQVGPVRGYGHKGRMLTAGELQQCNTAIPTGQPANRSTSVTHILQPVKPLPGTPTTKPPGSPSTTNPAHGPVVINTSPLRYAGRGPIVITTAALHFAGREPVMITTGTLRYAGRAPVVIITNPLGYRGQNP